MAAATPTRSVWPLIGGLWGLIVLGLILRLLRAISEQANYDVDLDTYLYLGWRLTQGGLMYVESFNAKWPLVAIVFAPISHLGSIGAYRLVVLLLDLCTGLLLGWSLLRLQRLRLLPATLRWPLLPAATALTLLMSQKLIGGLSGHLHHTANLFTVLALTAAVTALERSQRWRPLALMGCGFWLMAAVAMRPNLVIPLGLTVAGALVIACGRRLGRWGAVILAMAAGAALLLGLMALPYTARPDGLTRLWAGAVLLPWEWRQHTSETLGGDTSLTRELLRLLNIQVAGLRVWTLILIPALLLVHHSRATVHRSPEARKEWCVPGLSLLNLLGLALSFQFTHYWAHYEMMAIPAMVILISSGFCALPAADVSTSSRNLRLLSLTGVALLSFVLVMNVCVAEVRALASSDRTPPARQQDRARILQFLQQQPAQERGFISPLDFSFHWRLKQQATTVGVHRSWSLRPYDLPSSPATRLLGIATDRRQACEQLTAPANRFIIWEEQDRSDLPDLALLNHCLCLDDHHWRDISADLGLRRGDYTILQRED